MRVRPILPTCSLAVPMLLGCGADAVITLGQGGSTPRFFDAGRPVAALNTEADEHNPTLTEDMLEIYFTSEREDEGLGGSDVWYAKRDSRADAFGAPRVVAVASSDAEETSSAISADGNTLWVGSKRDDSTAVEDGDDDDNDTDIWRTQRLNRQSEWSAPVQLTELNTGADDIPRPVGLNGTVMPIASRRGDDENYETYLALRNTPNDEFYSEPVPVPELSVEGQSTVDAFMTNDGLLLFFNRSEGEEDGDLYMAWRPSPDEPFVEAVPLDAVNTEFDERDPWVNADGTRFFFSTNRGGRERGLDIYMTFIELPNVRGLAR